jgi:hypothetical protein
LILTVGGRVGKTRPRPLRAGLKRAMLGHD